MTFPPIGRTAFDLETLLKETPVFFAPAEYSRRGEVV